MELPCLESSGSGSNIFNNFSGIVSRIGSALAIPQFRWLWFNNLFFSIGRSMEMLALGWLVLIETDSPFWVGMVAGLRGLGQVSFGIFGGVIADRIDRRSGLILTQGVIAVIALVLGGSILAGLINLWVILFLSFLQGLFMAFNMPLNNSLIGDVVGMGRLLNAMSARLTAFNIARLIGSVLAGAIIANVGIAGCYIVLGFISLFGTLLLIRVGKFNRISSGTQPLLQNAREGVMFSIRSPRLRSLLLMSILMEMFGFSYHIMLPVIARDVLNVGASGLGFLAAAGGAGAMIGTIAVASLGDVKSKGFILVSTATFAGVFLICFALSPWMVVSLLLAGSIGATLMAYDANMATLLQLLSPEDMRGRIMGIYAFTFGFTPLGGFLGGVLATMFGAPFAVAVGGGVITLYALRSLRFFSKF